MNENIFLSPDVTYCLKLHLDQNIFLLFSISTSALSQDDQEDAQLRIEDILQMVR